MQIILYSGLLLFFLLLAAFFSAAETAFTAIDRLRLKFQLQAGDGRAEMLRRIAANPDRTLGVILLGSTLANIAAATLVTYMVTRYAPRERMNGFSVLTSVALILVVLIFCELTPKVISATEPERIARKLLLPTRFVLWLLSPLAQLASGTARRLIRLAGFSADASPFARALTEEEIRAIIAGSAVESMPVRKKEMLSGIFEIGATQVRAVMIPRIDVTAVEIEDPVSDILSVVRQANYSRIPVFRRSFDNVLGILHVKDLLQHLDKPADINIQAMLKPAHFVPDTAPLDSVLRQLQSMHLHMAIVVDEFGGVEGIVTLEDLLEEIVGEIRDEHDVEVEQIRELGPNLYAIGGNIPVKDFNRFFKPSIPESPEYSTVAGFLQTRTGRLLHEGESVLFQSLAFAIEKTEGFRIVTIRVRVPATKADGTARSGAPAQASAKDRATSTAPNP